MTADNSISLGEWRGFLRRLRRVRPASAPATILPTVLSRVGIADAYVPLETPIGPVYVAFNSRGVSAVMRADAPDEFEQRFRDRFGRPVHRVSDAPAWLRRGVSQYASADGQSDSHGLLRRGSAPGLPLDLSGISEFERAVLLKALEIPRGEVRTYGWIAREIGRPKAVRAVGSALRRNPIPLLIPCHRVVRTDSRIGDYALGSDAKRAILSAEGAEPEELERLARAGVRYIASDTTRIYCFPTCRNARRISERHRVPLSSSRQAAAVGYRPCKVCRPALAS